ncbi:hypothetical protein MHP7448_0703 [Mesomycoplasma hyopneumoniae 7448]|uniref:Uncharacterized protein n=1 Tax=Mesomycoplasma hyopneumoniae (strain 7448) TaxID=262722 RepID=A4Q7X0_MESH7|nr:hypothetical protein MHP7448_0703 [Mesomycoplasma hyopneumoniae 7448]
MIIFFIIFFNFYNFSTFRINYKIWPKGDFPVIGDLPFNFWMGFCINFFDCKIRKIRGILASRILIFYCWIDFVCLCIILLTFRISSGKWF